MRTLVREMSSLVEPVRLWPNNVRLELPPSNLVFHDDSHTARTAVAAAIERAGYGMYRILQTNALTTMMTTMIVIKITTKMKAKMKVTGTTRVLSMAPNAAERLTPTRG